MTPMKTMTRENCALISEDARAALEKVAAKYGLQLKQKRGTYDPPAGTFTTKWEFVCETEDGVPADFVLNAPRYGLTGDDFGKKFSTHMGTFTICGIKPRSRKYPILGKCVTTGKTYKFMSSSVVVSNCNQA